MDTEALPALRRALGPDGVLTPDDDLTRYQLAPNRMCGRAAAVLRPRTTADVRAVLRVCREHRLPVVVQGANSGLVGSGLPDGSGTQLVLSTERMRERFELDRDAATLVVSAGWTLDEINMELVGEGLRLPVEVGSSPAVGGMVATNTAGSNVLRYGDVRHRLLGLEVVTADADLTVIDTLAPLRKRNQGLDVTQLFVGTEGAYGVVTAASFELAPLPVSTATAWLAVPDPARLPAVLATMERRAGGALSAFELASESAVRLLEPHHPHLLHRVPPGADDRVLVEVGTADPSAENLLLDAIDAVAADVGDAVVGPPEQLWEVRHTIPAITERMHPVIAFDISTTRSALSALRTALADRIDLPRIELGHYGDGGLHLILPLPSDHVPDGLRRLVYDTVVGDFAGSFSAEHGIGPKNADAYARYVPAATQATAAVLKDRFDPLGILGWRAG